MSQYSAGLVTFTKQFNRHDNKEQNDIDNDIDINRQIAEIDERTRQIELDSLIASSNLYDEPMAEDIAQIMEQFRLLEQGQPTQIQQTQQTQQPSQASSALNASYESHTPPPLHKVDNYDSAAESDVDYPNYPDDYNDNKKSYAIDRELKRQQDEDFQSCLFADQEREREKEKVKEMEMEIKMNILQSQQSQHSQQTQQSHATLAISPISLTREELRAQRLKHFNK